MTIKWHTGETTWFILPREAHQLVDFLRKEGFEPMVDSFNDRIIHVNKELNIYQLENKWHAFTGYDKILKKCLEKRYK